MDFDDRTCPCPDLIELARRVFAEIPQEDQQWIEKVCDRVVFVRGENAEAEFTPKAEIRAFVSCVQSLSARGQRGIVAHEFGHAYVYSAHGYQKPDHRAEKLADMKARHWGFGADLDARNNETARLRDTNT